MTVAVLVLQPLAVERGAAGRPAEQETAGPQSPAAQIRSMTRWKPNIE